MDLDIVMKLASLAFGSVIEPHLVINRVDPAKRCTDEDAPYYDAAIEDDEGTEYASGAAPTPSEAVEILTESLRKIVGNISSEWTELLRKQVSEAIEAAPILDRGPK